MKSSASGNLPDEKPDRMNDEPLNKAKILIADDGEANVALLDDVLRGAGCTQIISTTNSSEVAALCAANSPDLVLLDLHMPHPDGYEVMKQLAPLIEACWFPILVLTADITPAARERALSSGAKDFVTKPFDVVEVLLRIKNLLEVRFLQLELRRQNFTLEQRVYERTEELHAARLDALERLAVAAEYRDDDTREHTRRVGQTSALIAQALGLPEYEIELIRIAAPLHDVGKIGIPDSILLKPGKLTPDEFHRMKEHVSIGKSIVSGGDTPVLQLAVQIILAHHEWWNGNGYPYGLEGSEIPMAGRIVAVADVFDALTHDRPYKEAWTIEAARDEIRALAGSQFDPSVVEAFETLEHRKLQSLVTATPSPMALLSAAAG
jgi:putative two-component system response regulator